MNTCKCGTTAQIECGCGGRYCSPCFMGHECAGSTFPADPELDKLGVGRDGQLHDDPYCGNIAPLGTYEARHGEPCGMCMERGAR